VRAYQLAREQDPLVREEWERPPTGL